MYPEFGDDAALPASAIDLGGDYVLLRPADRYAYKLPMAQSTLLNEYVARVSNTGVQAWEARIYRWARLRLPTGQIARTLWKEGVLEQRGKQPRRARMVKLSQNRFAEVQFFFRLQIRERTHTLAIVSIFSPPDVTILKESMYTVLACRYGGAETYEVIPVTDIKAAVAMVPLPLTHAEEAHPADFADRFFVVEKPGLEIAYMGGRMDSMDEDEDDIDLD
ncbi:hypothetical protein LXA43DRAFT_907996 [Ganoderma leucocontextum]|nr:hypothetical protein LXA43DRAFT_907996 [Ganoderma leucocontextum]